MYELVDAIKIKECWLFTFVSMEPFHKASKIRLYASDGSVFETKDFGWENFTHCFSEKKNHGFVVKEYLPKKYIEPGTKIELVN